MLVGIWHTITCQVARQKKIKAELARRELDNQIKEVAQVVMSPLLIDEKRASILSTGGASENVYNMAADKSNDVKISL